MVFDPQNKPKGVYRMFAAFINSCRALSWLYKNEAAFKQECALLFIVLPLSYWLTDSGVQMAVLIISILFIMMMEVINTAIEVVVDRIGLEIHPLSGLAKDLGSALVLMSILIAVVVWVIVLV